MLHTELREPLVEVRVPHTRAPTAKLSATTNSSGEDRVAPTKKKKQKAPYKDLERRREQNRVNAQKSYYRKLVGPLCDGLLSSPLQPIVWILSLTH